VAHCVQAWYACKNLAKAQKLDLNQLKKCQDDASSLHFGVDVAAVRQMLQLVQARTS
jgi:hypothetical protein